MKTQTLFLTLVATFLLSNPKAFSQCQEYVFNGNFEQHNSGCPTDFNTGSNNQFKVDGWHCPTLGTGDYYNCSSAFVGTPSNFMGYQMSHNGGTGYIGVYAYFNREYATSQLTSPLVKDKTYYVSMYVSLVDQRHTAIDRFGIHLSVNPIDDPTNNFKVLNVTPQIENPEDEFLRDRAGWTKISGVFIAKGGEKHITVGNFRNDDDTHTEDLQGTGLDGSYYFIDDVSVSDSPEIQIQSSATTSICPGDPVTLTADEIIPNISYLWSTGSTSTSITVNPTTTTTYTLTTRTSVGCSKTKQFTVVVKPKIIPNPGQDKVYCEGGAPVTIGNDPIATGGNGTYTFTWSPSSLLLNPTSKTPTANNQTDQTYTLNVISENCSASAQVKVKYSPRFTISTTNSSGCPGQLQQVTGTGAGAGGTYTWTNSSNGTVVGNTATLSIAPAITSTYNVIGTNALGCSSSASATIEIAEIGSNTINPIYCDFLSPIFLDGSTLTNVSSKNYTYQWFLFQNSTSTTGTPIANSNFEDISYQASVNQCFQRIVNSPGCKESTSPIVCVDLIPTNSFPLTVPDQSKAFGLDIEEDNSGNKFIVGSHLGQMDFPGHILPREPGLFSNFIAKYNKCGQLVWVINGTGRMGGNYDDAQIEVDNNGDIYVGAFFQSTPNIKFTDALGNTTTVSGKQLVLKINQAGSIVKYASFDSDIQTLKSIAVDHTNDFLFVSGSTTTANKDVIIKMNKNLIQQSKVYLLYSSSSKHIYSSILETDKNKNLYITGTTAGLLTFNGTTYHTGAETAYIIKYNYGRTTPDVVERCNTFDGSFDFKCRMSEFHTGDALFFTGQFNGTIFSNLSSNSSNSQFIAKIDPLTLGVIWKDKNPTSNPVIFSDACQDNSGVYLSTTEISVGKVSSSIVKFSPGVLNPNSYTQTFYDQNGPNQNIGTIKITSAKTSPLLGSNPIFFTGVIFNGTVTFDNSTLTCTNTQGDLFIASISSSGVSGLNSENNTIEAEMMTSGINKSNSEDIKVFPNPASSELSVVLPTFFTNSNISLTDQMGRKVFQQLNIRNERTSINCSELGSGVYTLTVEGSGKISQLKVIIAH